jgi:hypothetical protein
MHVGDSLQFSIAEEQSFNSKAKRNVATTNNLRRQSVRVTVFQ